MSHKEEAETLLDHALNKPSDSGGFFEVQAALVEAQLALVDAQEAANEQARIANLIALATQQGELDEGEDMLRAEALYTLVHSVQVSPDDEYLKVQSEIARILGIEAAE